jgi:diguanylate cyclase (GGDEF)-like protein
VAPERHDVDTVSIEMSREIQEKSGSIFRQLTAGAIVFAVLFFIPASMLFEQRTDRVGDVGAIAMQTLSIEQISQLAESFVRDGTPTDADMHRMRLLVQRSRANEARIAANLTPATRRTLARDLANYTEAALQVGARPWDTVLYRSVVDDQLDLMKALATSEEESVARARDDGRFFYALAAGAVASLALILISLWRSFARSLAERALARENAAPTVDDEAQLARMEELYLIVASAGTKPSVQIERALAFASRSLGYDWAATLEWLDGEEPRITAVLGEDGTYSPGDCRLEKAIALDASRAGLPITFRIDRLPPHLVRFANLSRPYAWRYCAAYSFPGDFSDKLPHCALFLGSRNFRPESLSEPDRQFVRLVGSLVSSSSRTKRHQKRLDDLAYADPLTGIANRANLNEQLEETIASAERTDRVFAVHYIDLDGFKSVNDEDGHAVGDELLKIAATRMEKVLRQQETIARIGGDEFVVLQTSAEHQSDAAEVARRLIERLARPFLINGRKYTIGGSVGVAMFPEHGRTAAELLKNADAALYTSKRNGKGCANFYAPLPSNHDADSVA